MNPRLKAFEFSILMVCLMLVPLLAAGDDIPKAAWKRPLGAPLENPGKKKTGLAAQHVEAFSCQAPQGGGSVPARFRGAIAGILCAGTSSRGPTSTNQSRAINSRCSRRLKERQREARGSWQAATPRAER